MFTRTFALVLVLLAAAPSRAEDTGEFRRAAVAADHPLASQAGAEMLRAGGNAVDAAVAASFCLSVVRPYSCGIGGGGFMVIYVPATKDRPAQRLGINYREVAPGAVGARYYAELGIDGASERGVHAVGVPGTVRGLLYALDEYGTLDRAAVLSPAIRIARQGWAADRNHVSAVGEIAGVFETRPELLDGFETMWRDVCLDGEVEVGDTIRNPAKGNALELIARHGAHAFYEGEIAEAIVAVMTAGGGPIDAHDLESYTLKPVRPLISESFGCELLTMPPPSSGGVAMQQIFGLLERTMPSPSAPDDPAYLHTLAECFKHAFADRAEWLADDVRVPVARLTGDPYLDDLAATIDADRTLDAYDYGSVEPAPEDGGTSHISVIDSNGMAVACTETINLIFGSAVEVPGFGFALNDEMDDFTTIPGKPNAFGLRQSDKNLPKPGKRPLSSMSPTIVVKDGRPWIIAGASGGPRIITGTTQVILNCMLFDMTPAEAVAAARIHHQWMPERLDFEDRWPDDGSRAALEAKGHAIGSRDGVGVVQVIRVDEDRIRAASDPRKGGAPAGY